MILPPGRTATAGDSASTPAAERVVTAPAAPPAGSLRTWTRWTAPSQRDHAIAAVPPVSIASSGSDALSPSAECVSAAPRTPPAGSLADWIRKSSPSQRFHANIAAPVSSIAARAPDAAWPTADSHWLLPGRLDARSTRPPTRSRWPSHRVQANAASPASLTAMSGSWRRPRGPRGV